jgi:hypothetical protein
VEIANQRANDECKAPSSTSIDDVGLVVRRRLDSTLSLLPAGCDDEGAEYIATILPAGDNMRSAILLLPGNECDGALLVDGLPPLSVSELPDGAELSFGAESLFFFSRETREIEIYAGNDGDDGELCPRCKRMLLKGDAIRRCSNCESPYHEGSTASPDLPELLCASYDPACAHCGVVAAKTPGDHEESGDVG